MTFRDSSGSLSDTSEDAMEEVGWGLLGGTFAPGAAMGALLWLRDLGGINKMASELVVDNQVKKALLMSPRTGLCLPGPWGPPPSAGTHQ